MRNMSNVTVIIIILSFMTKIKINVYHTYSCDQ